MSRFRRQITLPDFGEEGRQKLAEANVLVVGAGGLGCPALLYMAAAGVGNIGIADGDYVAESNLNRQILFGQKDIGKPKAETAAKVLKKKYADINLQVFSHYLTSENSLDVLEDYDLVLDGSDNFETRYMMSDACFLAGIPYIMGAIYQYEGQLAVLNNGKDPVSYRDIYPDQPKAEEVPNCSEAGVIGVLPGIIGTLQAAEVIKICSDTGDILRNKILFYNLNTSEFYKVDMKPAPASRTNIPKTKNAFKKINYNTGCRAEGTVSWEEARDRVGKSDGLKLIDIREPGEKPVFNGPDVKNIPMRILANNPERLRSAETVILFCKAGKRSKNLAAELRKQFPGKQVFSIAGGILDPASPLKTETNEAQA